MSTSQAPSHMRRLYASGRAASTWTVLLLADLGLADAADFFAEADADFLEEADLFAADFLGAEADFLGSDMPQPSFFLYRRYAHFFWGRSMSGRYIPEASAEAENLRFGYAAHTRDPAAERHCRNRNNDWISGRLVDRIEPTMRCEPPTGIYGQAPIAPVTPGARVDIETRIRHLDEPLSACRRPHATFRAHPAHPLPGCADRAIGLSVKNESERR